MLRSAAFEPVKHKETHCEHVQRVKYVKQSRPSVLPKRELCSTMPFSRLTMPQSARSRKSTHLQCPFDPKMATQQSPSRFSTHTHESCVHQVLHSGQSNKHFFLVFFALVGVFHSISTKNRFCEGEG